MHAGQLFSEHFLKDGVRLTSAYRALAGDPYFVPDLRQRLESTVARFLAQAALDEAQTEQCARRAGFESRFPPLAYMLCVKNTLIRCNRCRWRSARPSSLNGG